jgi:hypothetical protein
VVGGVGAHPARRRAVGKKKDVRPNKNENFFHKPVMELWVIGGRMSPRRIRRRSPSYGGWAGICKSQPRFGTMHDPVPRHLNGLMIVDF